ncbi:uncharacterized protein LOC143037368 [Oratosquilla oratoria]|uniref:uncharacterized protein LOC143037368 n=1 Tax=Oratosquilla oratoria TaxID=337810 RepID=UPI003F775FA0
MSDSAYPESVLEMSRLLQEANLKAEEVSTSPESTGDTPPGPGCPQEQLKKLRPATLDTQESTAPKEHKCFSIYGGCGGERVGVSMANDEGGGVSRGGAGGGGGGGGGACSPGGGGGGEGGRSPRCGSPGPVSLSQILARPVYSHSSPAPASPQLPRHQGAQPGGTRVLSPSADVPAPAYAPRGPAGPLPSSPRPQNLSTPLLMPVATMGNGSSGPAGGGHHGHHHHHHHHQNPSNSTGSGGAGDGGGGPPTRLVYPEDYKYMKGLIPELKAEVRDRDMRLDQLEAETLDLRRQLKKKTEELTKLQREVHKLKPNNVDQRTFTRRIRSIFGPLVHNLLTGGPESLDHEPLKGHCNPPSWPLTGI